MNNKWKIFLSEGRFHFDALKPKDNLPTIFWESNKLNRHIVERLSKIARNALEYIGSDIDIKDITLTGSMASYNWHAMSDIDLHIILDFAEINEDLSTVKKMLDQYRINWNKTHDILIGEAGKEHEVEIYFQDVGEHHSALGVYSVMSNQWLTEPSKVNVDIDLKNVEKKAETLAKSIDHVSGLLQEGDAEGAYNYSLKLKNKVKRMRTIGLQDKKYGIYSTENLAFKMLRNAGLLETLSTTKINSYDKMMSLSLSENKKIFRTRPKLKSHKTAPRRVLSKKKNKEIIEEIKDYFNNNIDPDYMEFDQHELSSITNIMDNDKPAPWDT